MKTTEPSMVPNIWKFTPRNWRKRALTFGPSAAVMFAAGALLSCAAQTEETKAEKLSESLYVPSYANLWNDNVLGAAANIPVCFAVRPDLDDVEGTGVHCPLQSATRDCNGNLITDPSGLRLHIRKAIQDTWMRAANIEYLGWGDCPIDAATNKHKRSAMPHMVEINFKDDENSASVGKSPLSEPSFIIYGWSTIVANGFSLVHEAGHNLGFEHEWLRSDYLGPGVPSQFKRKSSS